jgi:hypothetical protein
MKNDTSYGAQTRWHNHAKYSAQVLRGGSYGAANSGKTYNENEKMKWSEENNTQSIDKSQCTSRGNEFKFDHSVHWLKQYDTWWDLAICVHVPQAMRLKEKGYDDRWLQIQIRHCLNRFDRLAYKSAYTKHGFRSFRLVTLEWKQGVGWHAHIAMIAPLHLSYLEAAQLLEHAWRKHTKRYRDKAFEDRIFWAQELRSEYSSYCIKNINSYNNENYRAVFDEENSNLPIIL